MAALTKPVKPLSVADLWPKVEGLEPARQAWRGFRKVAKASDTGDAALALRLVMGRLSAVWGNVASDQRLQRWGMAFLDSMDDEITALAQRGVDVSRLRDKHGQLRLMFTPVAGNA